MPGRGSNDVLAPNLLKKCAWHRSQIVYQFVGNPALALGRNNKSSQITQGLPPTLWLTAHSADKTASLKRTPSAAHKMQDASFLNALKLPPQARGEPRHRGFPWQTQRCWLGGRSLRTTW